MFALFGAFGAFLGFMVYFAFGGYSYLSTGKAEFPWNGLIALILFPTVFCALFLLGYIIRDKEYESGESVFFHDQGSASLFGRRLAVILPLPLVLWFIWELMHAI